MLQYNSTDDARSLDQRSTPARKSRPAVTQPAYFRLTRVDTTRSTSPRPSSGQRSGGLDDGCGRRFTVPLDKTLPISADDRRRTRIPTRRSREQDGGELAVLSPDGGRHVHVVAVGEDVAGALGHPEVHRG